jgi:hypothetical protein
LGPWVSAGKIVENIDRDLDRLIPASSGGEQQVWYVQNLPDNYKGAYIYRLGLGATRSLTGKAPRVEPVPDARTAPLDTSQGDAFAIGFGYTGESWDYDFEYLAGITQDENPPTAGQGADVQDVWDFRSCESNAAGAWQVEAGEVRCEAGRGLVLHTDANGKATISSTPIFEEEARRHGRYLRLRVNARYSPGAELAASRLRGYGGIPLIVPADTDQSSKPPPSRSSTDIPLRPDGQEHTYWLTLPFQRLSREPTYPLSLELDTGASEGEVEIRSIAVDIVQ